jgi:hypothetical protein
MRLNSLLARRKITMSSVVGQLLQNRYRIVALLALGALLLFPHPATTSGLLKPTPTDISTSTPTPPTPTPTPIPLPILDSFESYEDDEALQAVYTINAAWGKNEAWVTLASPPEIANGSRGLAFHYEIRHDPPDDYAGTDRYFPSQDWRGYNYLHLWVRSDASGRDFVVQFREDSMEVWKYTTNLSKFDTRDFKIPLSKGYFQWADWSVWDNGVIDLGSINGIAFYAGNGDTGKGTIYIDAISLVK